MASSTINSELLLAQLSPSCSLSSLIISSRQSLHRQTNQQLTFVARYSPSSLQPIMDSENSVSVGIELEFLVAIHQGTSKPAPSDTRWSCPSSAEEIKALVTGHFGDIEPQSILKVCDSIASNGVPVACNVGSETTDIPGTTILALTADSAHIRVWNKQAARATTGGVARSHYWLVVAESHLGKDCAKKAAKKPSGLYEWYGIELNSPILSAAGEFNERLPTLGKLLTSIQDEIVVGLNSGCGLHFHVNQPGKMSPEVAKRVTSLVWLLEDALLYRLCHPFRSSSPYSARVSVESRIAMEKHEPEVSGEGAAIITTLGELIEKLKGRKKVETNLIGAMKRLWSQPDLESLGKALRKFDEGPVHTTTRCALVVSKYDTMEFRYPESMFDIDYISCWADLVRHLYSIALLSHAEFTQILFRVYELVTREEAPRWPEVMEAIGFHSDQKRWQRRLDGYTGSLSDLDKQGILPQTGQ